jgi:hypothetical protein
MMVLADFGKPIFTEWSSAFLISAINKAGRASLSLCVNAAIVVAMPLA